MRCPLVRTALRGGHVSANANAERRGDRSEVGVRAQDAEVIARW
jgi:hypothetical protein